MPRKYVKIDVYGKEILELKREGKTNREIAQKLGVDRKCIRNWVFRFNRQQRKLAAGIKLHPKGRPRKDAQPRDIVAEQAYEINRLKMENELLRDFMRSMERKCTAVSSSFFSSAGWPFGALLSLRAMLPPIRRQLPKWHHPEYPSGNGHRGTSARMR